MQRVKEEKNSSFKRHCIITYRPGYIMTGTFSLKFARTEVNIFEDFIDVIKHDQIKVTVHMYYIADF